MTKTKVFQPDQVLPNSKLRILKVHPAEASINIRYDVEYGCCGLKTRLKHRQVQAKERQGSVNCVKCGHVQQEHSVKEYWRKRSAAPQPPAQAQWPVVGHPESATRRENLCTITRDTSAVPRGA